MILLPSSHEVHQEASDVDQIKVSMLIVQGGNDPQVRQEESDQIAEALRERGIDVEYILKEDERHGFLKEENRLELYRAMERFLAEHLDSRPTRASGQK